MLAQRSVLPIRPLRLLLQRFNPALVPLVVQLRIFSLFDDLLVRFGTDSRVLSWRNNLLLNQSDFFQHLGFQLGISDIESIDPLQMLLWCLRIFDRVVAICANDWRVDVLVVGDHGRLTVEDVGPGVAPMLRGVNEL